MTEIMNIDRRFLERSLLNQTVIMRAMSLLLTANDSHTLTGRQLRDAHDDTVKLINLVADGEIEQVLLKHGIGPEAERADISKAD